MPYRIRKTEFTWDPDQTRRAVIWDRIKSHIHDELDRIQNEHVQHRRLARRRAAPAFERNRQILHASEQGASAAELGRAYGMRPIRVREIIRAQAHWQSLHDAAFTRGDTEFRAMRSTSRHLEDPPVGVSQTTLVLKDP